MDPVDVLTMAVDAARMIRSSADPDATLAEACRLVGCRPADPVALARQAGADVLLPQWAYVTPADVAAAHAAGLAVATWTTSDPATIRQLLSAGVDAVVTNHPDVARSICG